MKTNKPSMTAEMITMHRAREYLMPESQRICNDPYAGFFISQEILNKYKNPLKRVVVGTFLRNFVYPGINGSIVARVRYIDDYLETCIEKGLKQLVVIGAGYDTRAHRFEELKKNAKVFEIDFPGTQERKKRILAEIFDSIPEHVVFVPIRSENDKLDNMLFENGYDNHLKTLFIMEGVIMYMPPETVDETLAFIAENTGEGSSVIFDLLERSVINGTSKLREAKSMLKAVNKLDEPFLFGLDPNEIEDFLTIKGFCDVKSVNHKFYKDVYFKGKNRKRKTSGIFTFVHATVGEQQKG